MSKINFFKSLRVQIPIAIFPLTLILVVGIGWISVHRHESAAYLQARNQVVLTAGIVSSAAGVALEKGDRTYLDSVAKRLEEGKSVDYLAVTDASGKVVRRFGAVPGTTTHPELYISMPVLRGEQVIGDVDLIWSSGPIEALARHERMVMSVLGSSFMLGLAGILYFLLYRMLLAPVKQIIALLDSVEGSDLTKRLQVSGRTEMAQIGRGINRLLETTQRTMEKVRTSSVEVVKANERIGLAAKKVSEGSQVQAELTGSTFSAIEEMTRSISDVAGRVESLSAHAIETSSAMLEIDSSISEVAKNADGLSGVAEETSTSVIEASNSTRQISGHVDTLSKAAEEMASSIEQINAAIKEVEAKVRESAKLSEEVASAGWERGMMAVVETMDGMEKIESSVEQTKKLVDRLGGRSEEIGTVLTVIDDVTKQTNLLALNAAIIAAQAGEHGKSFAVVADAIKDLAERTSSSTREIGNLIEVVRQEVGEAVKSMKSGMENVEQGTRLSKEAGEALRKILESSNRSAEATQDIERATVEQVKGMGQIAENMERVTSMIQQIMNATTEQSAASDQIMRSIERMRDMTRQVKNATAEQAKGSKQITKSIERMNEQVQFINRSASGQVVKTQSITGLIKKAVRIMQENVVYGKEMGGSADDLNRQAIILRKEVYSVRTRPIVRPTTLRLGAVPLWHPEEMRRRLSPLAEYLSRVLNIAVEIKISTDYPETIEEIGNGSIHLCFMTPSTYLEAQHKYNVVLVVKAIRNGLPVHHSVIATRQGSGIERLEDLKDRTFAFGSEKSTSSSLVPWAMLNEAGVKLQHLKSYAYLGHHDAVAKAVIGGEYDAGGLMESVALEYGAQGLFILKRSADIPEFNFCASGDLDPEVISKLRVALKNLNDRREGHMEIVKALDKEYNGFIEALDRDYDGIRSIMRQFLGIQYS